LFGVLLLVVLIDRRLWKLLFEQRQHNKAVERLLAEIRAAVRGQPLYGIWRTVDEDTPAGGWWRGAGEDSPPAWFFSLKEAQAKAEELASEYGNAAFEARPLKGAE